MGREEARSGKVSKEEIEVSVLTHLFIPSDPEGFHSFFATLTHTDGSLAEECQQEKAEEEEEGGNTAEDDNEGVTGLCTWGGGERKIFLSHYP